MKTLTPMSDAPTASTASPTPAATTTGQPNLVLAAPFRAHVTHLMQTAQVPWPAVAYQAGVPAATVRTLVLGRNGRLRSKIDYQWAVRLLELRTEDLSWMRRCHISAERSGARIRLLRGDGASWEVIGEALSLPVEDCQALARGERTSCSTLVDILAQSACQSHNLRLDWEWELPGFVTERRE
ncbi:MAG: hypothetical protein LBV06_02015 [Propionibacteriaceae bacterium]|jgi:hypothetical protein|nr:hypothetical protein [Propionibacteriaceae bacterium]